MAIKYQIHKSGLLDGTKYLGRVVLKGSFDREMVIARMLAMGTSLSRQDIAGVLSLLETAVENINAEGNKVTLDGFMQFTPTISGTFDGEKDTFAVNRNAIYVTAQISSSFNTRFSQRIGAEKIVATEKKPFIMEVDDLESGTVNTRVSCGNIVTIYGDKLKFDPKASGEYLRFVNADQPTNMVPIGKLQKISDKEIVFLMPEVSYGRGYFELASKMETQRVRVGKSASVVVVA